jgi:hypothetical protein
MPKTTTANRTFKIVDLIRNRSSFKYIEVPKFPVEVDIEVTTSGLVSTPEPAPSAVFDRLEKVAREKLDEYESIITEEIGKIETKIDKLFEQPGPEAKRQAEQMIEATNATVKKALLSAEPAAQKVIEQRLEKEKQGDKLLTEARVKTGIKFTFGTLSLAGDAAKLAATAGADVTSYFTIAKTLFDLGTEIRQQLKGEETLRKDLKDGVQAFLDSRESVIMQALKRQKLTNVGSIPKNPKKAIEFIADAISEAGKEVSKGKNADAIFKDVMDFVGKGINATLNDAEKARVAYRNHTAKMRQKVDAVSGKADELAKKMKSSTTLKDGVKIGAECMNVKAKVRTMSTGLDNAEGFLDEMQAVMKGGGLECDDSTIIQKLKRIDISTIATEGAGLLDNIKTVYDLISNVAAAVH